MTDIENVDSTGVENGIPVGIAIAFLTGFITAFATIIVARLLVSWIWGAE